MKRSLDNCALIKTCTANLGLEAPRQVEGKCEGYVRRRGQLHKTCAHCSLCLSSHRERSGR